MAEDTEKGRQESVDEFVLEHSLGAEHEDSRKPHIHVLEDGTVIEHTHLHHESDAIAGEEKKAVLNRLSRAIGHLESVRKMVGDDRDPAEILIQLSAVRSAINNTGKTVLHNYITHCMVDAVKNGDMDAITELQQAIDQFMK
ncbi:MAG: metal-sensing transcriptional repressor [Bilifractor sp.]|jgi:DNA-binding FrmR family transcriptional regulator|nr:metal-sensing transcriptional repressor [Lachnospiraceae bacterium]